MIKSACIRKTVYLTTLGDTHKYKYSMYINNYIYIYVVCNA